MGLVYSQSALLRQRLEKQSAAEKRKYNSSTVNLAGYTRDQIKRRVSESDQFTASEAAILTCIADQHPGSFTLTVTEIRAALKFGELRWSTGRKGLERKSFVTHQSVALDDKSRHWFLDVDFTPLRDAKYGAPPPKEKTSRLYNARAPVIPDFQGVNPLRHSPPPPLVGGRRECAEASSESSRGVAKAAQAAPGQQTQPRPTTHDHPPAPKGGGAVLHAPGTNNTTNKDKPMQINFSFTREFFDFLGRNGMLSVRVAAQIRKKKDGQRGAPMGTGARKATGKWNPVAVGSPVRTAAAVEVVQALLAHLERNGKRNMELVCAAADDSQGLAKSILLDDLREDGVKALKAKWRGPGAILETSPGNYQAVLILAEPLDRDARRSITVQLVALLGADAGASGVGQFHRLPGSVNYKASLAEPFVCRLAEYFTGVGEGVQPTVVKPVPKPIAPGRPGAVRPMRKRQWREAAKTPSDLAFRFAVELLDSGASGADVEAALSSPEWLGKHSAADWPARTRENAQKFRAGALYGSQGGTRRA